MWFPSEAKVHKALARVIADFDDLGRRVSMLGEVAKQARAVGADDGELDRQMRKLQLEVLRSQNNVREVKLAVTMGAEPWRRAVPFIQIARDNYHVWEAHVAAMEEGAADGQRRAARDIRKGIV